MIHESAPVTNSFVSVPVDMGQLNCGAFIAGVINGVLDSARFVSLFDVYIAMQAQFLKILGRMLR